MPNSTYSKVVLLILRLAMGWLMFYAGIVKLLDSDWSAAGYLGSAKTFSSVYAWLASPGMVGIIDFLNAWGLTLLGISLILGLFVRWSSILGAVLMVLYYFPVLEFPKVGPHGFLIDEHIIYSLVLIFFSVIDGGKIFGVDNYITRKLSQKNQIVQK